MSMHGVSGEDRSALTKKESAQIRRRSFALLLDIVRPHRRRFIATMIVVVFSVAMQVAGPAFIAAGIDQGLPAATEQGNFTPLMLIVGGFLISGFGAAVLLALYTKWSITISQDIMNELRLRVFAHTQRLSMSFHEKYTSGRIIARQTSDISTLGELLNGGVSNLVQGVLFMGFTTGALLLLDPWSALPLVGAIVPVIAATWWFSISSRREFRASRTYSARLIIQFVESMAGIRAVKAFRREHINRETYGVKVEDYREATRRTIAIFGVYDPMLKVIGSITVAVVLLLGAFRVLEGGVEIGVLLAAVLYTRNFFSPIENLAMFYNSFQSASAALEKISGVLEEEPALAEPVAPEAFTSRMGALSFRGVSFAYNDQAVVLPSFDLEIRGGQIVALVGATGAGKSTLAKLIARFYDPTKGVVALDGVNLREISDSDLRQAVVLVTQEAYMFSGSVEENIRLGKPSASFQEVQQAARAVGAHKFILALPEGYETDVNKRGGRLSAGQRQLVSFARAFIANPSVLILDEATASLDIPSERLVQHGLKTLLANRTAIIIAHRLSTVEIADRILVMDAGEIVEDGPAAQLRFGKGRFATLHTAWLDSLV
jgi:ATP-binding cassette, subfamily B, bacterial